MSVFGDLKDFPLVEVLPVLAFRRGALHVAMAESSNVVTLYFDQQAICGVRAENRLLDPLDALLVLRKLLAAKQGVFWFEQDTAPEGPAKLAWPVKQLLLELAKETDESVVVSQELPDPATRFCLTERAKEEADVSLSESAFLRQARPFLEKGTSVGELAKALQASASFVAVQLHRLRVGGFVEPARARDRKPASGPETSLLLKLWRALTGGQ